MIQELVDILENYGIEDAMRGGKRKGVGRKPDDIAQHWKQSRD